MLTVATTEIFNVVAMDQLRAMLGAQIEIKTLLAGEAQLEDYIDQFYGYELSVDGILKEIETGEIDYESLQAGGDEYTQPMVRLVDALLVDAVKRGASDIHFEPEYAFLRIRYRIDGVLETVRSLHKTYWPGITVRVKVVSGMNIAETRAPQDGRLSLTLNGRPIDFRVSTQPTIYGENIVLRVLDREKSIISLDQMNLPEGLIDKLELMLARPEGILIVTGPTGSGKTTTLYSLLAQVNDETVNIMTLEDPVEYPVDADAADLGERSGADGFRQRHPLDHAPGPGHHPGGRGARQGNRGDGVPRGDDRPPGVHHAAHQLRARRVPAAARHRHPARHHGRQHHRRHRPAPGARAVPALQGSLRAGREERMLLGDAPSRVSVRLPARSAASSARTRATRAAPRSWRSCVMDGDLDELVARRATAKELRTAAMAKGFRPLAEEGLQRVLDGTTSLAEVSRAVDLTGATAELASDRAHERSVGRPHVNSHAMPSFQYKAIDKTGRPARGGLDAVNEVDLELRLRRMGLDLITCKADRPPGARASAAAARSPART